MIRIKLFLLLFLPLTISAQYTSNWLTPVSNIEFEDDLVVYYFQISDDVNHLQPIFITDAFRIVPSPDAGYPVEDNITRIREWLVGQVNSFAIESSVEVKEDYLKVCALYIIWSIGSNQLPDKTLEDHLTRLEADVSVDISRKAMLVKHLYTSVCKGMREMN
jgi:hypothetical protein